MKKEDPFKDIYAKQNSGTNKEKYANLPPFPQVIDIELVGGICSAACSMCPVGRDNINNRKGLPLEITRKRGYMDKFLFLKIIGEIKEHKTPIRFVLWGEPTLHPDFWWFVREAKNHDLLVHLNTNGSTLRAMREKIDSIKISLHSNSKKVREGIDALVTMNTFKTASITDKEAEKTGIDIMKEPFTLLDNAKQYRQFYPGIKAQRLPCCPEVFNKTSILWDGKVTACCNDSNGDAMIIGDLYNNTIKEIWESEDADYYRKLIAEDKHWNLPLCSQCFDLGCY